MNEVLFLLPCMAALTQLVAKSFGFVFGLTTMTLRIARWCFDFLFEKSIVTARSEIVKGPEPSENVLLGKSTLNQIERCEGSYVTVLKNTLKNNLCLNSSIYSFPGKYGLDRCGLPISKEQL